ncbi:MAG: extracellular solute-binding protein, partial [Actinomycetota bacterium]|nr:extracellular solute-binding protein [Actinomycetota bacterium]
AELEGLDADARRERLIELAVEEGATVTLYSSLNAPILDSVAEVFEEDTGVAIDQYRASSEAVRDRILQEAQAGFRGADVIETNGPEMQMLDEEGTLQPFTSPLQEDLGEGSVAGNWAATRFNIFAVAWNTDLVAEGEQPQTYEDLADPQWEGQLAMEIADVEWYRAVWQYLVDDQGMSEEEADELFEQIASNATFLSGHTTFRQLLVAGEYSLVASDYSYGVDAAADEGAPVAWEPPVEPLFARANGIGLANGAPNPAAAVLLTEWLLSDGQDILLENFITPAPADLLDTGDADVRTINVGEYLAEQEEWTQRYEELQQFGEVAED